MALADKGLLAGTAAEPAGARAAEAFPAAEVAVAEESPVAVAVAVAAEVAVAEESPVAVVAAAMAAPVEAGAFPGLNSRFSGPAPYPSNRPS